MKFIVKNFIKFHKIVIVKKDVEGARRKRAKDEITK